MASLLEVFGCSSEVIWFSGYFGKVGDRDTIFSSLVAFPVILYGCSAATTCRTPLLLATISTSELTRRTSQSWFSPGHNERRSQQRMRAPDVHSDRHLKKRQDERVQKTLPLSLSHAHRQSASKLDSHCERKTLLRLVTWSGFATLICSGNSRAFEFNMLGPSSELATGREYAASDFEHSHNKSRGSRISMLHPLCAFGDPAFCLRMISCPPTRCCGTL